MRHVDRPEPNSTPERAMDLLLEKARLVFGDQGWSAREYGTRDPRVIPCVWLDVVGGHQSPGWAEALRPLHQ
jgi:hypothetical protein